MTQQFGLEAILSAKLDKRSVDKDVVKELEDALDKASTIEPEAEMGALERQMKDLGGMAGDGISLSRQSQGALEEHSRAMAGSKMGTAVAGAAGGRVGARMGASRAGAAASRGAGALGSLSGLISGGLLMVGLAGVVGIGILKGVQKMAEASPAWNKVADMWGMAWNLFFRPVGDELAKHIFPHMKDFLQLAIDFYKKYQEEGLLGGLDFLKDSILGEDFGRLDKFLKTMMTTEDRGEGGRAGGRAGAMIGGGIGLALGGPLGMAVGALAGAVIGAIVGTLTAAFNGIDWRDLMEKLFGKGGGAVYDAVTEMFPGLSASELLAAFTFAPITAPLLLTKLSFDHVSSKDFLGEINFRAVGANLLIKAFNLPTRIGAGSIVGAIGWPTITKSLILAALGIGGGGGGGGGGGDDNTGTLKKGSRTQNTSGGVLPAFKEVGVNVGVGGSHFTSGDPTETTYGTGGGPNSPLGTGGSHLTAMASGGITTGPTEALVGEAGTEAVIPLERLPRLMAEGMKSVGETSTGGMDADMSGVEDKLDRLLRAVEDMGGDVVLRVDGETIARTSRDAGDRFLSRREVHK